MQTVNEKPTGDLVREQVEQIVTVDGWQERVGSIASGLPADLSRIAEDIGSLYRVNWTEIGASFLTDLADQS